MGVSSTIVIAHRNAARALALLCAVIASCGADEREESAASHIVLTGDGGSGGNGVAGKQAAGGAAAGGAVAGGASTAGQGGSVVGPAGGSQAGGPQGAGQAGALQAGGAGMGATAGSGGGVVGMAGGMAGAPAMAGGPGAAGAAATAGSSATAGAAGAPALPPCDGAPMGVAYASQIYNGPPTDRPPPQHGDLNLELRGFRAVNEPRDLVTYNPDEVGPDPKAPRLFTLYADDHKPLPFAGTYQVGQWDWGCNCNPGTFIEDWPVTMVGFAMTPGETVELPSGGYDVGNGYQAYVLYAADNTITLKYTAEDNVVYGYTIHLMNICVAPELRALYDQLDGQGRPELPVLRGNQPLGRARGGELLVTIRDTGAFMDPRSQTDWW